MRLPNLAPFGHVLSYKTTHSFLIFMCIDLTNLLGDPATQPTLFAPTNEAFDSVSDIDYPTRDVLMYHITPQPYNSSKLHDEFVISTLFDSAGLDNSPQRLRISLSEPGIPSTSLQGVRNSLWRKEPEVWISETSHDTKTGLYVNRAKVTVPDLLAKSGGMVHGVNRIIRPPGETILDEIMRRGRHFTYLAKAWTETGVDGHVRDGKSMTLFAAHDKAWKGTYFLCAFIHQDGCSLRREMPANHLACLDSQPCPRSC